MNAYPCRIRTDDAGRFVASFPDVPEALTDGATREEALEEAADALLAAFGGYMSERRPIPPPSKAERGQRLVYLSPLITAKLALYDAMLAKKVSNSELGRRLELSEGAIRRLVDIDHRSHISQVESALAELGKRLVLHVEDAA